MRLANALKLHNEDEVRIKKTNEIMKVVEVVKITVSPKEDTANKIHSVKVMLEDGNWYGYKEIK